MSDTMIGWVKRALTRLTGNQTNQLVRKARRGDRNAYGQLYLEFVDPIYRYIYFKTYQNETTAQDLTQTVFLKAWNKIGEFDVSGSFQAWLYQIARNSVVDYIRSEKPKNQLQEAFTGETGTIEEQMDALFIREHIKEAISKLPDEQRELITLKYIEDMTNSEISHILGKSEEAVRAQQHRALKQLRKLLSTYVKS